MVGGSGPKGLAFFTLKDVGEGRHLSHDGSMALERRDGDAWVEIGRFGSAGQAARGLDEQVAAGADSDHLRLRSIPHPW